jgi:hypothetical protein
MEGIGPLVAKPVFRSGVRKSGQPLQGKGQPHPCRSLKLGPIGACLIRATLFLFHERDRHITHPHRQSRFLLVTTRPRRRSTA